MQTACFSGRLGIMYTPGTGEVSDNIDAYERCLHQQMVRLHVPVSIIVTVSYYLTEGNQTEVVTANIPTRRQKFTSFRMQHFCQGKAEISEKLNNFTNFNATDPVITSVFCSHYDFCGGNECIREIYEVPYTRRGAVENLVYGRLCHPAPNSRFAVSLLTINRVLSLRFAFTMFSCFRTCFLIFGDVLAMCYFNYCNHTGVQ